MHLEKENLIKGNRYLIAYNGGPYEYNNYIGKGTYTGETDDIDGNVYGFVLDDDKSTSEDNPAFFPIESIFDVK